MVVHRGVFLVTGKKFSIEMCQWRHISDPYSEVKQERPVMREVNLDSWRHRCVSLAMSTII